jgi:hypothetical protein
MRKAGFRRLLVAFAVTGALACIGTGQGLAADHGAGARFSATASFNATAVVVDQCTIDVTVVGGTALGTHIGTGGWADSETLNPCSEFFPLVHVVGNGVFTAANGDTLLIHYDMLTPFPDATGQIHPRGTFTITGGTGRFAGASGGGAIAVDGTAGGAETAVFDGTIVVGDSG